MRGYLQGLCRLIAHVGSNYNCIEGPHFWLQSLHVDLINDFDSFLPPAQLSVHIHQCVVGHNIGYAAITLHMTTIKVSHRFFLVFVVRLAEARHNSTCLSLQKEYEKLSR